MVDSEHPNPIPSPEDAPEAARDGLANSLRAFRHRGYTLVWWSSLVSGVGNWMANLAVPIVIYMLTQSPLWVGIAAAVQFIPNALIGPWAGALTDRLPRKWVMFGSEVVMGLAAFSIWLLWTLGFHEIWALLIPLAVQGAANGVYMPSSQSFVNELVPREDIRAAIAFNSVQFNIGRVIGPVLAGGVIALSGPTIAFLVNAITFAAVPIALVFVQPLIQQQQVRGVRPLRDFAMAVGRIARTPSLRVSVMLSMAVGLLGNPLFNMTVVFGDQVYAVGALEISLLGAALGVGAIVAAPIVSGWSSALSLERIARGGLLLYIVALTVLAAVPVFAVGVIALIASGAAFLAILSSANTTLQLNAPDEIRGRIISARIFLFTASMPVGVLLQGALADWVGVRWSTFVAAIGFLIVTLLLEFPRRSRRLASLDDVLPRAGAGDGA